MGDKVYIITHKEFDVPRIDGYMPLAVGCSGKVFPSDYIRDDLLDNISTYNDSNKMYRPFAVINGCSAPSGSTFLSSTLE